jgi:quercetin dioxygenase-like cupin family protein
MPPFTAREPAIATPIADDDLVRVVRYDFAPGAETGWHKHGLAYVVVPVTHCAFLIEEAEGSRRVDVPAGAAYRREAGIEHNVVNGGDAPMSFVEIEIKR